MKKTKGGGKEARNEWQRWGNRSGAQSRQSAKLFLQSSELGLPHPLTRKQVRGWGSPSSDEGTYTVVLYIYNCNCWWRHATLFDLFVFIVQYEDMNRRIHWLHCLACWRGLDASWSRIEVGLLVVCWDLLWIFKVKVSREIAQCSPCRTRTYATRDNGSNGPVSECVS